MVLVVRYTIPFLRCRQICRLLGLWAHFGHCERKLCRRRWGQKGKVPLCRVFHGPCKSLNDFSWGHHSFTTFHLMVQFIKRVCKFSRWQKVMSLRSTFIREKGGWGLCTVWLFAFAMSPSIDPDKVVASTLGDNLVWTLHNFGFLFGIFNFF